MLIVLGGDLDYKIHIICLQVLSCDWSKLETHALATAGSDGLVRGWDLRRLSAPMFTLKGYFFLIKPNFHESLLL